MGEEGGAAPAAGAALPHHPTPPTHPPSQAILTATIIRTGVQIAGVVLTSLAVTSYTAYLYHRERRAEAQAQAVGVQAQLGRARAQAAGTQAEAGGEGRGPTHARSSLGVGRSCHPTLC